MLHAGLEHSRSNLVSEIPNNFIFVILYSTDNYANSGVSGAV